MKKYKKHGNGYVCNYCGAFYPNAQLARQCFDKHNILYVELSREDATRLMNFLYTGDWELLTPSITYALRRSINRVGLALEPNVEEEDEML